MKEIIGDDYPTYEDSVNMTLAEQKKDSTYTYMKEIEQQITKENIERLMLENLQLRHRLACVKDDIAIIDRHIKKNCNKRFKRPSRNKDGSVFAEEAWHNITNIEISCDLSDESVDEWGSDLAEEYRQKLMGDDDPVFEGHLKNMEASGDYLDKYIAKKITQPSRNSDGCNRQQLTDKDLYNFDKDLYMLKKCQEMTKDDKTT